MNKLALKNIFSLFDSYDVFLFDLWGVIIEGDEVYPGVVEVINQVIEQKKVFFITNAPRPNSVSLARIKSWGINVTAEMVFTSGEIARSIVSNSEAALGITRPKLYHLGADRNDDIMRDMTCEIVSDLKNANLMMLTLTRNEGEDLTEFDSMLQQVADLGIITICANPDTIIPRGNLKVYCPGFFAAKISERGGKVIYTGKPESAIYEKVLEQIPGIPKDRIVMIGDTFDTDILGALRIAIHSALVLTGNAKKFHMQHWNLEDKLEALETAAKEHKVMPNFIIELALEDA